MQEKFIKFVASMLVVVMLYSLSGPCISYAVDAILSEGELESQTEKNSDKNVDFDVYYEDGKHSRKISVYGDEVSEEEKPETKNSEKTEKTNENSSENTSENTTSENTVENTAENTQKSELTESANEKKNNTVSEQRISQESTKTSEQAKENTQQNTEKNQGSVQENVQENAQENEEVNTTETTQINAQSKEISNASNSQDNVNAKTKIYAKVKVKNIGSIDDAIIDFSDCNFNIESTNNASNTEEAKSIAKIENNKVYLNRLLGGEEIVIELDTTFKNEDQISADTFNKFNNIKLTGKFINEKNEEIQIERKIVVHTEWNVGHIDARISEGITKYVPFNVAKQAGVLVQTTVYNAIKNSKAPIKESNIEVIVPKIANELPEKVSVIAKSTAATNGKKDGADFTEKNWQYNKDKGIITINVKNDQDENKNISWLKNTMDEFNINYIYSSNVLSKVQETGFNIDLKAKIINSLYNNTELEATAGFQKTFSVKDQIGSLVDVSTKMIGQNINKGYLYTNKKETSYGKKIILNVSDTSLVDEINIKQGNEIFKSEKAEFAEGTFINKKLVISKAQFTQLFGEDGKIVIKLGEKQIVVNTESEVNSEGNIEIDLENSAEDMTISTSKPVAAGVLEIGVVKAIAPKQKYSSEEIKTFNKMATSTSVQVNYNNGKIPANLKESEVTLEEPTSKVTANINRKSLSTVVKNENVEILAVLETNSIDDVLYKNPKIEIALPSQVKDVNVTNCKTLYSDELKISSTEVKDTDNGKTLIITLEGTQTQYNDDTTKGINVVVNMDITVDRFSPSKEETIKITYTNENEEKTGNLSIPVKFVAPIGLVTVNSVSGLNKNITLINGKNETANQDNNIIIDTYSEGKQAVIEGQIINNYNNNVSNLAILGTIPSTEKEGNTFAATLGDAIKTVGENVKVYYSAKANADADLKKSENGWVEGQVNYKAAKSFLIIVTNQMEKGASIKFAYKLNIPEQLSFNNTVKTSYTVTYDNNDVSGVRNESKQSGELIITTGKGPNLEVSLNTNDDLKEVSQGQYVEFTANIKNIGTDATNTRVAIDETYGEVKKYSNGFEFIDEENTFVLGNLKAGETKTLNFTMQIKEDATLTDSAEIKVGAVADKITSVITGSKKLKINKGRIVIENIISAANKDNIAEIIKGEKGSAGLYIKNISGEDLNGFTVKYSVGEEIDILEAGETEVFNAPLTNAEAAHISDDKHSVTFDINKLANGQTIILKVNTEAIKVGKNIKLEAEALGSSNNDKWSVKANTQLARVKDYNVEINSIDINGKNQEVKEAQDITYSYSVKNTGDLIINSGKIECKLPEGVTFKSANVAFKLNGEITYNEKVETLDGNTFIYEKPFFELGEEVIVKITANINKFTDEEIQSQINEKELASQIVFTGIGIDKKSNKETYYAIVDSSLHAEVSSDAKYALSGKIWNDANKNSQKEENEAGMANIQVALLNRDTMKVAKNENNENITTKTVGDGSYKFENVPQGKYVVAYLYDSENYYLTQYQKDGILKSENSDAVEKQSKYNGENRVVGLTDEVQIVDSSIRNVDVGVIEKEKFELGVTEQINKVSVNAQGKVKQYSHEKNSEQLAKVSVNKKQATDSTMVVEYKVNVTNDGNVPGYANKVVNYIADNMKFTSELNPDWYMGEDGNIYSTSLTDYKLEPGETKTLTLVLTKNINNTEKEIVNSKAEVSEEYNEQGIESVTYLNGESKQGYASVEIENKETSTTTMVLTLLIFAILITSGSVIYINKDKLNLSNKGRILKNKILTTTKNKIYKIKNKIENMRK